MRKILVVDDDLFTMQDVVEGLEEKGYEVATARNDREALKLLEREDFLAALVDYALGPDSADGLELLRRIKEGYPDVEVIIVTGVGDYGTALEAGKLGAFNFLRKPVDMEYLLAVLRNIEEMVRLRSERDELAQRIDEEYILVRGRDPGMAKVYSFADRAAEGDSSVLITGETGVGKEVLARYIHKKSKRAERPFVVLHCPAVPETLAESELFGYRKGAFTGASEYRKGKIEVAEGGTLFLDEVGDLSLAVQAKLLRFLENKEYSKLGEDRIRKGDVRVIASTNRNLETMVEEGKFRQDLYYRLMQLTIYVPPLRERRRDVPILAEFFAERACRALGRPRVRFSGEAMDFLMEYEFPGNVRELKNMVERAVLVCAGDEIGPEDLMAQGGPEGDGVLPLKEAMRKFRRDYIRKVLALVGGNQTRAAKALGISRPHLNRILRELEG